MAAAVPSVAGLPVLVGLAPRFLIVVSPLIAGLFAVYLALAAAAHRAGLPAWCAIPAAAVVVAWPVALIRLGTTQNLDGPVFGCAIFLWRWTAVRGGRWPVGGGAVNGGADERHVIDLGRPGLLSR